MTEPETDWLRGVLPFLALLALRDAPRHGYAIAQHLDALGLFGLKVGTLYPVLTRLEAHGLLEASWVAGDGGPGRKQYALTSAGRDRVRDLGDAWSSFSERMTAAVAPATDAKGSPG